MQKPSIKQLKENGCENPYEFNGCKPVFAQKISSLNVQNKKLLAILDENGYQYIGDLILASPRELLKIPNLGKRKFIELLRALESIGLNFEILEHEFYEGKVEIIGLPTIKDNLEALKKPIDSLGLGKKLTNALWLGILDKNKIDPRDYAITLKDLVKLKEIDIIRMQDVGHQSLQALKDALSDRGLSLGMQD